MKPRTIVRICMIVIPAIGLVWPVQSRAGEQEDHRAANGASNLTAVTNQPNVPTQRHHPASPGREVLQLKGFAEKERGVYRKNKMALAEAEELLNFGASDMTPIPSAPPTEQSYWVALKEGRCVITVPGGQSVTSASVVDLVINTNAIPTGRMLTPRPAPANKDK